MSSMKLLEIKNLNKSFDKKEILKDVNLSVSSGKIFQKKWKIIPCGSGRKYKQCCGK